MDGKEVCVCYFVDVLLQSHPKIALQRATINEKKNPQRHRANPRPQAIHLTSARKIRPGGQPVKNPNYTQRAD
jgi:hypothetical protein